MEEGFTGKKNIIRNLIIRKRVVLSSTKYFRKEIKDEDS